MKKILLGAAVALSTITGYAQVKDPAVYKAAEGYQIENLWAKYGKLGNRPDILAGTGSRGMAVLNGKIYVTYRTTNAEKLNDASLLIYDAATGEFEKQLKLTGDDISNTGVLTCNDAQVDDAGNLLVCTLSTNLSSESDAWKVWKINPETGEATLILTYHNVADVKYRIDAFGVYGDITKDGYLMAALAGAKDVGGAYVLRWNFKDGKFAPDNEDNEAIYIEINEYANGSDVEKGNSTAPRVTPIDEDFFYLDPQDGWATIYDMSGNIVEGFGDESLEAFRPETGGGNNGVDEFTYNNENFVVYVITNNTHPEYPQAWNVCKLGENQSFTGMAKIARIPEAGMSTESNAVRTALPRIEVKEDGAYIYLFATNAGMAAYKMSVASDAAINNTASNNGIRIQNGRVIVDEASAIEVYTVAGQKVASIGDATSLALPAARGMYIVKAVAGNGAQQVAKIVIE